MYKFSCANVYKMPASATDLITYEEIKTQNQTLSNSVLNMREMYSADTNRLVYKSTAKENARGFTAGFFYTYYSVFLIFMILMYFKKTYPWWLKVLIVAFFLVYPFVIYYIENFLYMAVMQMTHSA